MLADPSRPRRAVRGLLLAFATAGLAAVCYFIAVTPPTPDSLYPKCMFHQLTGLHCPGCGTGRAAHFLLNGQILTAARFNILAILFLPFLTISVIRSTIRRAFALPTPRRKVLPTWCIWLIFTVIIVFAVLRNLPVYPFTLLAPQEL